ncbi:MAG TPA: 4Fe-4S binding protein [Spirochaetota bacterium]|nr:4Fe-4S binding protein [Spirochaetota bacterium]HPC40588.1 4Fe-4S binding protein [Spirochaetota bacterium]HPL17575.1 4Fe-4S binding protein [Spirochaetota bacterium]HQF07904.1 4Fe-4S binding protein [Spirochaetota bacterium]HQH96463.1 4Fe-4S binding protein [Spirochaetota bacterium]
MASRRLLLLRRLAQTVSVFVLAYILWNTRYPLSGYINPEFYFLIDPFAMIVTSIAERVLLPGLIYAAVLLVITFVVGRGFCGWICPLGALLDFLSYCKSLVMRIFRKKERENDPLPLRYGKYLFLGATVIAALAGVQLAWFLDPITIFVRAFSFTIHPLVSGSIDRAFTSLLAAADYPGWLEWAYDYLREGFLNLSTPEFNHAGSILIILLVILFLSLIKRRFWCRHLCPLGAALALPARFSPLRRDVSRCEKNCGLCRNLCRMNAIRMDNSYIKEECILCLDCVALCPNDRAAFTFGKQRAEAPAVQAGGALMTRGSFIAMAGAVLAAPPASAAPSAERANRPRKPPRPGTISLIRPPGALPEEEFIQRCIRCGNCMKVCPTNVLQPLPISDGLARAWSPVLDTRRGYCEYRCNLCGRVCPTDAIAELPLERKQKVQIGTGVFNKTICIPYAKGENCIVCEEHCPVPEKAIRVKEGIVKGRKVMLPHVVADLCIGCAICELKCPTRPDKGIVVVKVRNA